MDSSNATHEDANLIMRLFDLRREEKLRRAREWFGRSFHCRNLADFNALCPAGSEENTFARMVTSYWEMAASFVASGVLDAELFFQSGQELLLVWTRIKNIVDELRVYNKNPHSWSNLEKVGNDFIHYWERTSPGSYAAFEARMAAMAHYPKS
jgi:hypothetical protein